MLSEGYDLLRGLDGTGFDIPMAHGDVKKPGKNPGYRVDLDDDGCPQIVEEMDGESMGRLWYHREGNQNAFPVVKIQHALLSVSIDDPLRERFDTLKKTEQTQRIKLLREAIDTRGFQLTEHDQQAWERLRNKALDWLDIFVDIDEHYLALPCTLRRFVESMRSPTDLLRRLCQLIVQRLEQGRLQDVVLAEKLLLGVPDKESPGKPAKAKVPVVFNVAELNYPVPVTHPKMGSYVIRRLLASDKRDPDGICALEGVPQPLKKKRFPEPQLGALGETKLFSKNKDTPCEFRYLKHPSDWKDAAKSFPVGQRLADEIAAGLHAITVADLKGKTLAHGCKRQMGRKRSK